jgi:hypothetical protein
MHAYAIIPTHPVRSRSYAWGSISVDPDPPRAGKVTKIEFPLMNPGPDDVVVERIEVAVAEFGIGVRWRQLEAIGPFALPADPHHIEHAALEWVPASAGHRCVRASIYLRGATEPFTIGRNLHVIEAAATQDTWTVRFRLGNPEPLAAPIVLTVGGNYPRELEAVLRVNGRALPADRPVTLGPREEVDAELLLRARGEHALHVVRTVEATINGRLVDGIQIVLERPSHLTEGETLEPLAESVAARIEPAYVTGR